jgi:chemotaxis protein MotB
MRKKKHPEHVNHERWLVSYADFITLLFAFFVVMFAVSQVDSRKVGRFTESFSKAVGIAVFPHNGHGFLPGIQGAVAQTEIQGSNDNAPLVDLSDLQALLRRESSENAELAKVQVVRRRNELVLRLPEDIVFASGDDSVREAAVRTLRALAATLRPRRVDVRVEGHTDNRPIHTTRFRSNWDLSTARATTVLARLIDEGQMAPERLSAAGYGEFHPIADNSTDANRQQNRRVDLVVTVQAEPSAADEPVAPAATGDASTASEHDASEHDASEHEAPAHEAPAHEAPAAPDHGEHPSPH